MSRFHLAFPLLIFFMLLVKPGSLAQQQQSASSVASFFDGSAKFIYNLAWPTATYSAYKMRGVIPVAGGFDVSILLDGRSGIDGSDLWLLLLVQIRKNGIDGMRVLDDNHFLMAPFQTSIALGQAAVELERRYAATQGKPAPTPTEALQVPQSSHAAQSPAPAGVSQAVCLENLSGTAVSLTYRWGDQAWTGDTVAAGMARVYYWKEATSPTFIVRYDADFAEGLQLKSFELARKAAGENPTCELSQRYKLAVQGNGIEIFAE